VDEADDARAYRVEDTGARVVMSPVSLVQEGEQAKGKELSATRRGVEGIEQTSNEPSDRDSNRSCNVAHGKRQPLEIERDRLTLDHAIERVRE